MKLQNTTLKKVVKRITGLKKSILRRKLNRKMKNRLEKEYQDPYPDFTIIEDIDSYHNEFATISYLTDVGVYEDIKDLSKYFISSHSFQFYHDSDNDYEIIEFKRV